MFVLLINTIKKMLITSKKVKRAKNITKPLSKHKPITTKAEYTS
jgi:hypothetical protein